MKFSKKTHLLKWNKPLIHMPGLFLLDHPVWLVLRSQSQPEAEPEVLRYHNSPSGSFYTTLVPVKHSWAVIHSPAQRPCQCEWKLIRPWESNCFKIPKRKYLCLVNPFHQHHAGVEEQDRQVMPPTDGCVYGGAEGMLSSLFMVSYRRSHISMAWRECKVGWFICRVWSMWSLSHKVY